jgi:hypothetical protein
MLLRILRLGFVHPKNLEGFRLLAAALGGQVEETEDVPVAAATPCDILWVPVGPIHPGYLPLAKQIVYGPHNFVTPDALWAGADFTEDIGRAVYNCLGSWNQKWCAANGGAAKLPLVSWPFPVDTEKFRPSRGSKVKDNDCVLYWKHRRPEDLEAARKKCEHLGLRVVEISYGSYTEEEYRKALHSSRFVVWVGGHESQGFALQEALACGVPAVIWDVEKLGDEWNRDESRLNYGVNQKEYSAPATTIPWWDGRCGIRVTEEKNLLRALFHMACTWDTFRPREFVEETLSPNACARVWVSVSGGCSSVSRSEDAKSSTEFSGDLQGGNTAKPRVRFADTVSSFTE